MLILSFAKGVLAKFQKPELASAAVAIPTSPIPPARASGEILKNGTAEVTTLIGSDCAFVAVADPANNITRAASLKVVCFMRFFCLG